MSRANNEFQGKKKPTYSEIRSIPGRQQIQDKHVHPQSPPPPKTWKEGKPRMRQRTVGKAEGTRKKEHLERRAQEGWVPWAVLSASSQDKRLEVGMKLNHDNSSFKWYYHSSTEGSLHTNCGILETESRNLVCEWCWFSAWQRINEAHLWRVECPVRKRY